MKHSVTLIGTNILPQVKPKHKLLFQFGLKAFSLTTFSSLNSNARSIIENVNTASSKVYRLVSNENILSDFSSILKHSDLVHEQSLVNVDFSTFCGFETLAFATQTQSGRAIPVWANCLTYPLTEVGSQNKFVLTEIERFATCLGFYPSFVFDRGFWIPEMMRFFLDGHITFYLRIKKGTKLEWTTTKGKSKKSKAVIIGKYSKDANITLFGHKMRLIISPLPEKTKERWYILTNDFNSDKETVLNIYNHRFEIEETFKDLKHVMRLKKILIQKILTFRILLMFVSFSFWVAYWCQKIIQLNLKEVNIHKKRSFFKVWWEGIQRELKLQALTRIQKILSG